MFQPSLGWYIADPFAIVIVYVLLPRLAIKARYAVEARAIPFWSHYWVTVSSIVGALSAAVILGWELISPYHVPGVAAPPPPHVIHEQICEMRVNGACRTYIHVHWQTSMPSH